MTSHDELSYYLSQGLAIRVDGITISDANLEHLNLICKEYSRAGRLISQLIIIIF